MPGKPIDDLRAEWARKRGPLSLYAILGAYMPGNEVEFIIDDEQGALDHGIYVAANDLLKGYGSPNAIVYRVGPVAEVGTAKAADAPDSWEWARGVHAKLAEDEQFHASLRDEQGKG